MEAAVRAVLFIECGGIRVGGRGLVEALEAVEREGSLRRAAASMGMSYRRLWARIRRAEQLLGARLVDSSRSGARLTPEAKRLVEAYREAERMLGSLYSEGLRAGVGCYSSARRSSSSPSSGKSRTPSSSAST